jgi:beta-lactamase regulating signal transducer with metallopeptidase domain
MTWTTWLADVAMKSSALLLLALFVNRLFLRRAPAALRHVIWILALVSSLAAPMLTALLPGWHVPLLRVDTRAPNAPIEATRPAPRPAPQPMPSRAEAQSIAAPATPSPAEPAVAREAAKVAVVDPLPLAADAPPNARLNTSAPGAAVTPTPLPRGLALPAWPMLVAGLWMLGTALLLLRLTVATLRTARLSRRARTPGRAPWIAMARALARSLGAPAGTRFLRSEAISMPIACGVWKPAVVLPAEADAWPSERLRVVLLHELAHVRRRDCLTQAVADAACAVFWFNPLAWMAVRELRRERERACDDMVLAAGTSGPDYAEHLLAVARAMRGASLDAVFSSGVAMAHRSELEGRLMAILDDARPRRALTARSLALASTLSLSLAAPLAAMNPWVFEDTLDDAEQASAPPASAPGHPDQTATGAGTGRGHGRGEGSSVATTAVKTAVRTEVETDVATSVATGIAHGVAGGVAGGIAGGVVGGIVSDVVGPGVATALARGFLSDFTFQDVAPKIAGGDKSRTPADPKMVAALTEALKDSDAEVRKTAISALAHLRDGSTFDAMVVALRDKDDDVRQQAAFALGQMRDRRAVAPLTGALSDANPEVRQQAVFGLGQLRDVSTLDALATALKDTDAEVRQQAAFALSQIRDVRALPALVTALQDKDDEVRQQAAFALSQIRDPKAVDGLLIAIKDTNAEVRQQALFALGQIGDPRAADAAMALLKDPNPEVRQQAAHALGQMLRK